MKYFKIAIILTILLCVAGAITACGDRSGGTIEITTARQVNDLQSLKNFVLDAKNYLEKDYNKAIADFRREDGPWRYEEVYLFVIDDTGNVYVHVGIPVFEGQQQLLIKDLQTGEFILDKLIREGLKPGGGFVEYYDDNPSTPETEQARKINYVTPFNRSGDTITLIIGAGFFPD